MKALTHGSLFSGIDGFSLAARWMGWQNLFTCEKDDFCNRVLEHYEKDIPHYEDIRNTDFTLWRGRIDVLTGGFPCFTEGTMVLTNIGLVPIEEVRLGDICLTKDGNWRPVNAVMAKDNAPIIDIKYQGDFSALSTTSEHPFWAMRKTKPFARRYSNRFDTATWVNAGELKVGDLIGQRVIDGDLYLRNDAFWFLVGRWLGDGWVLDGKRKSKIPKGSRGSRVNSINHKTVICCNKSEKDFLETVIKDAGYKATISEERTAVKFIISSKELTLFLKHFGKYAHGKKLPGMCFLLNNTLKEKLFEGWLSADGYIDGGIKKVTTVSPELARGMAKIATDVFKVPVSISKKKVNRVAQIEGRIVNERDQYCVSINPDSRSGFYKDGFVWTVIKKITNGRNNTVFNIGIYEDESYTANGIAVHNCQPYSVAGKRLGKEDDRHLWPEMLRAIRECSPRWVVGENVRGIISWNGGLVFDEVQADLEALGYEVTPYVLPACAVNAPHRRDRVWFIAHAKSDGMLGEGRDVCETDERQNRELLPELDITSYGFVQKWSTAHRSDTGVESLQSGRKDGISESKVTSDSQGKQGKFIEFKQPQIGGKGQRKLRREDCPNSCSDGRSDSYFDGESVKICKWPDCIKFTSNPHSGRQPCKEYREAQPGQPTKESFPTDWSNFPTQSPVCTGDDGISTELLRCRLRGLSNGLLGEKEIDKIISKAVTKLRTESIKAGGNSVVVPLVLQIFKAIEQWEKTYSHRTTGEG